MVLGLFSLEVWDRKKAIPPRNNVLSISYLVNIDGQIWLAILLAFESFLRLYVKFFVSKSLPRFFSLSKPAWILDFSFGNDSHKDFKT